MTGLGLCLPQLGPHVTTEAIRLFCRSAEELGYSSLWVQDHFMWPLAPRRGYGGRENAPVPKQYQSVWAPMELLTAAAMITDRVALGTSVLVAGNHWPVSLAQRLATIDHLSNGRLIVGLGVGWSAEEHDASGTSIEQRGRRIDDFLATMLACWGTDPVSHRGPFFDVPPSMLQPKPKQQPRPKLLSGMWSVDGMRRTAAHYDGWNPAGRTVADVVASIATMNETRPATLGPLEVYHRAFSQYPLQPTPAVDPVERLRAEYIEAQQAGFTEFIIEHNFSTELDRPSDWAVVPEKFASLLR
jgi:probable F420-dependent oxidoreductase